MAVPGSPRKRTDAKWTRGNNIHRLFNPNEWTRNLFLIVFIVDIGLVGAEAERFHFPVQMAAIHAEAAGRGRDLPAEIGQGLFDDGALEIVGEHAQGDAGPEQAFGNRRAGHAQAHLHVAFIDGVVGGEDHQPFDDVAELAHVAREAVGAELFHAGLGDVHAGAVVGLRRDLEKVFGERGDVFAPAAERRQIQGQDVEAIVEVGPKLAFVAQGFEIAVGRGDDAHIDLEDFVAADALDFALLQDAEQLGLHGGGHIADFIEEERAATRALKFAAALFGGARERAGFVAEHFALDELAGDGGAVHFFERSARALGREVDGAGHELLAGAALASDEHRRVGAGGFGDLIAEFRHRAAVADQIADLARLRAQRVGLRLGADHAEGVLDDEQEAIGGEGFFKEVDGAEARGFDGRVDRRVAAHHDDGDVVVRGAEALEERDAVAVGERHIEERDVVASLAEFFFGDADTAGDIDRITFKGEGFLKRGQDRLFVVENQHMSTRHGAKLALDENEGKRPVISSDIPRKEGPRRCAPVCVLVFLFLFLFLGCGCSCGGSEERAVLPAPLVSSAAALPSSSAVAAQSGGAAEIGPAQANMPDAGAGDSGEGPEESRDITAQAAFAAMFVGSAEKNDPAALSCKEKSGERDRIHCMLGQLLQNDPEAARAAQELFSRSGHVVGLEAEQWMDGGYRGKLHLVPEAPVNGYRKHLEWVASASYDFDRFFEGLKSAAAQPVNYRHRPLLLRYFRSVAARTPSAFAYGWTVAYNVSGSLHRTPDAVRETMFHEVFHLNDKDHKQWSVRALSSIYDGIAARCGTKIPCLTPYAPSETVIRGGTYYAFHPDNGVVEYAAELGLRYYREQRAVLLKKPLGKKAFKCGPPENVEAWNLLKDEFFGGADLVPGCK